MPRPDLGKTENPQTTLPALWHRTGSEAKGKVLCFSQRIPSFPHARVSRISSLGFRAQEGACLDLALAEEAPAGQCNWLSHPKKAT